MSNLLNMPMTVFTRLCNLLSEKAILKLRLVSKLSNANVSRVIMHTNFRIFELSIRTTEDRKSEIEFSFERRSSLLRPFFLCRISFLFGLSEIGANFTECLLSSYGAHRLFKTLRIRLVPVQMQRFMAVIKPLLHKVDIQCVNSIGDENDPELIRMCMNFLESRELPLLIISKDNAAAKIDITAWVEFLHNVEVAQISVSVWNFTKETANFFVQIANFVKTLRIRVYQGASTEYVTNIKQIVNSKCERLYFEHGGCPLSKLHIENLIQFINGSNKKALGVSAKLDSFFEVQIGMFRIIGDPSDQSISMKRIDVK